MVAFRDAALKEKGLNWRSYLSIKGAVNVVQDREIPLARKGSQDEAGLRSRAEQEVVGAFPIIRLNDPSVSCSPSSALIPVKRKLGFSWSSHCGEKFAGFRGSFSTGTTSARFECIRAPALVHRSSSPFNWHPRRGAVFHSRRMFRVVFLPRPPVFPLDREQCVVTVGAKVKQFMGQASSAYSSAIKQLAPVIGPFNSRRKARTKRLTGPFHRQPSNSLIGLITIDRFFGSHRSLHESRPIVRSNDAVITVNRSSRSIVAGDTYSLPLLRNLMDASITCRSGTVKVPPIGHPLLLLSRAISTRSLSYSDIETRQVSQVSGVIRIERSSWIIRGTIAERAFRRETVSFGGIRYSPSEFR